MALIFTTLGMVEESELIKTEGFSENDFEKIDWQEWHKDGELVKREVQMFLKQGLFTPATASL